MISIEPQGKVFLCKTELENDYKHQLTFANLQAQENYFNSVVAFQYATDNFTYIKKDNVININENIEKILPCNYLFYRNDGFYDAQGNIKTYYCFINNMEYINENCTRLYIETDVWQTYQFDINYKASFVEREHTNDDTIGANTYPESLETGEYIINSQYVDPTMDDVFNDTCYVLGCSVDFNITADRFLPSGGGSYNGLYSGVKYFYFSKSAQRGINQALAKFAENGQADTITGLFIVPKVLAPASADGGAVTNSATPVSYTISFAKTYGLGGYTPKNNKLKVYPYCYVLCNNMAGSTNIYNYEDFSNSNCTFSVKGALCPGGSIRLTPTNYKGIASNDNESLMLGKFPICNYQVDMYTNWLTQNSVNVPGYGHANIDELNMLGIQSKIELNKIKDSASLLGDMLTGNLINGIKDTANTFEHQIDASVNVGTAMIQAKQHSLIPPSVRGDVNAGDVLTSDSKNNFRFYRMSIKREYAEKIDQFFTMFGYATNKLKVPNINGRTNWNYVKTAECNFTGDIPQQYLDAIRKIFCRGITFWHNPSTFLDYSQDNSIVS